MYHSFDIDFDCLHINDAIAALLVSVSFARHTAPRKLSEVSVSFFGVDCNRSPTLPFM